MEAWTAVGRKMLAAKFPHFLGLAYVMLAIPEQSASVERGFSQHRVLKSRLRNAMHVMTLDSAMRTHDLVSKDEMAGFVCERADETYNHNPPRHERRPLFLRQLLSAAGLNDEGGQLPDCL